MIKFVHILRNVWNSLDSSTRRGSSRTRWKNCQKTYPQKLTKSQESNNVQPFSTRLSQSSITQKGVDPVFGQYDLDSKYFADGCGCHWKGRSWKSSVRKSYRWMGLDNGPRAGRGEGERERWVLQGASTRKKTRVKRGEPVQCGKVERSGETWLWNRCKKRVR